MNQQEAFICKMADEIRAGRLRVTGDMTVQDADPSYIEAVPDVSFPMLRPKFEQFTVKADLDCRRIDNAVLQGWPL